MPRFGSRAPCALRPVSAAGVHTNNHSVGRVAASPPARVLARFLPGCRTRALYGHTASRPLQPVQVERRLHSRVLYTVGLVGLYVTDKDFADGRMSERRSAIHRITHVVAQAFIFI